MRLIDADALRAHMYHEAFETDSDMQRWDGGCWIRYKMFENAIESAPAADVRENVRWVFCNTSEPETSGDYLLYRPHFWGSNKGQITVCYWNCHEWSDNYRSDAERYLPVIDGMAWMPLPEIAV